MEKSNKVGWIVVLASFLLMFFIFTTSISCMGIYIKPVSADMGISRTAFSMTITISSFAMMISAIVVGKLVAKVNIRWMMLLGVLMSAGSLFIFSAAQSLFYFYAGAILMGWAVSLTCNIPISVLVKEWFVGENEGLAVSIAFVGTGAGAMVLTPLYSYIIENIDWRTSFMVAGICILFVLLPAVIFGIRRKDSNSKKSTDINNEGRIMLGDAVKMPATWMVFLGFVIISLSNMVILNQSIPYWTDNGLSPADAAKLISIASGALIIGKLMVGRLIDKIGARITSILCTVMLMISVIALWIIGNSSNVLIIAVFAVGYAIGAAAATVAMPTVISYMYGKCEFGAIMGIFSMTGGVGGMLQVVFSAIYESTGNYNYAWSLIVALCLVLIISFAVFVKPQSEKKLAA